MGFWTVNWLRRLFGSGKPSDISNGLDQKRIKEKRRRDSGRPASENESRRSRAAVVDVPANVHESEDANKHAIAVAAATAAVAEAALAAAQAAAAVVRLTSGGVVPARAAWRREETATVKIQSAFRAYLARRALRALKGLVKLQALVRGHIVRKQMTDIIRRMQALVRVQARARLNRVHLTSTGTGHRPRHTRSGSDSDTRGFVDLSNWLDIWVQENSRSNRNWRDEIDESDKILEVDTWRPNSNKVSCEASRKHLPKYTDEGIEDVMLTAQSSPQVVSATSSGYNGANGAFTPGRSGRSRTFFSGYLDSPNYMAYTTSSRAKVRSHSAPKQRIVFDQSSVSSSVLNNGVWTRHSGIRNRELGALSGSSRRNNSK